MYDDSVQVFFSGLDFAPDSLVGHLHHFGGLVDGSGFLDIVQDLHAGLAKARGVLVAPAEDFAINANAVQPALRLSLCETREEKLARGLDDLAELISEGPGPLSFPVKYFQKHSFG